jgi:Cof subfamily protein (haloacid dehalogenase superfamily)
MRYRLVALDIDGTIRSVDRSPSARTRRAVDAVREAGAVVTLATGRMFRSAVAATADLNITAPIVSFQGAHVANPVTGEVLWHRPLTPAMALAALDALATWPREIVAYHDDHVYVNTLTPWVEGYAERNQGRVHVADDLTVLAEKGPTRLLAVGEEDDVRRLQLDLMRSFGSELHVTRSLPHFCEILHPDAGKHKALEWLCGHLGLSREQTIAFGNGYNDVHMLDWAGLAVTVAGAVPELLDVADRLAPPMEEDGVAQVLKDLLAKGQLG